MLITLVKVVGNKRDFRIKYNSGVSISRYKVMLVAKRFYQIHGVEYIEIFNPVVKALTIMVRLLHENGNGLGMGISWNKNEELE